VRTEPPLRIAFDATSLLGTRTGVGQVTAGMLTALAARPGLELSAFAVTWRGREELAAMVPSGVESSTRRFPARLARTIWPHVAWPTAEHWTGPVDVVHAPSFVAPPARAPAVVTVHDLTFHRFPEMCTRDVLGYPRLLHAAFDRGAIAHTFSEFVAAEVRDAFSLPPERVVTIPPGIAATHSGDPARGRALAGADRYIVALGTIEPRKNLPMLVRAFDIVASRDRDISLVVAGPDGWGVDEFDAALNAARHRDRIARIGYVADDDRRDLLAGATALAYPSLYEGFGHPPLEAMQAGIPVVASNRGALPEVLGDAALLPDPLDPDALAEALQRVVSDDSLRAQLVERGSALVQRYTWDDSADALAALYARLARAAA
jgi:glycosyltransferase involved in cell wall biosynthesis